MPSSLTFVALVKPLSIAAGAEEPVPLSPELLSEPPLSSQAVKDRLNTESTSRRERERERTFLNF